MNDKKGLVGFSLITVFTFVLGSIVTVLLVLAMWQFFGPQDKAEAATKKMLDDLVIKVRTLEAGDEITSFGFIDKDAMIIGFDSGDRSINGIDGGIMISQTGEGGSVASELDDYSITKPKQCGFVSNSCICACKGEKCEKVLECKGFPSNDVKRIVAHENTIQTETRRGFLGQTSITSKKQVEHDLPYKEEGINGYYLIIDGGSDGLSISLKLNLENVDGERVLYIEKIN